VRLISKRLLILKFTPVGSGGALPLQRDDGGKIGGGGAANGQEQWPVVSDQWSVARAQSVYPYEIFNKISASVRRM
jgi:hypothetical protein